jgi:LPS sulfotransferase NodH
VNPPPTGRSPLADVTPLFFERASRLDGGEKAEGRPRATTSCLIAATPRSGSWLLAEILANTGVVGEPHEYFRPDFVGHWAAEWGLSASAGIRRYIAAAITCARSANGVFTAKLHWYQLLWLTTALAVEAGFPPEPPADLANWFPNPRYLLLLRRDKARQAISYYRAATSGVWFATDEHTRSPDVVDCDFQQVRWFEDVLVDQETRWRTYLSRYDVTPLEVWYEDVVADRAGTVARVLELLGLPTADIAPLPSLRLRRQADAATARILDRYLAMRDGLAPKPADLGWHEDVRRFVAKPVTSPTEAH